jgi:hypothetical protein
MAKHRADLVRPSPTLPLLWPGVRFTMAKCPHRKAIQRCEDPYCPRHRPDAYAATGGSHAGVPGLPESTTALPLFHVTYLDD